MSDMRIGSPAPGGTELEFGVLGPLEVRRRGRLVPLGAAKQRALLSILLLNANKVVPAARLIDLLWAEKRPESAKTALQVYVSQLRKLLEPRRSPGAPYAVLQSQPPGYLVRLEPHQLDLSRFAESLEAGRHAMAAGDTLGAAGHLRQALALWRGAPLADFALEPFAQTEIARLNEMRMGALEERIDADLELGRHAGLVAELQALSIEYPLRERLSRQLMIALYRSGRQGDASEVYQRTRLVLVEQLGMEPGPEMQTLLKAILNQDPKLDWARPVAPLSRQSNLPRPPAGLVGRGGEIDAITLALRESALVTLTGAGGVGKTRLALEVAHRLLRSYPDGVWFVDFAPVRDGALVINTLMYALGLRIQDGNGAQVLTGFLNGRNQLLILDNCEHLIDSIAPVASNLIEACPDVHVLATSREPLAIPGEVSHHVSPLSIPDAGRTAGGSSLLEYESVALFCERAKQALGTFALTSANTGSVVRICRLLDGIPLALELAARRLTVLSIDELCQRLTHSFHVLSGGSRTAAPRQRAMAEAMAWSYELLTDQEKALFRRLSVFAGGFVASAAEAVCAPYPPVAATVDVLSRLVDKSLVLPAAEADGHRRLRMLEVLRQFGHDRLVESDEAGSVSERHAAFFADEAERWADLLRSREQAWALEQFELEHDNIRAAIASSQAAGHGDLAMRLIAATWLFWYIRGYGAEGLRRTAQVCMQFGVDRPLGGEILIACSKMAWQQGDLDQAEQAAAQALARCESQKDLRGIGLAHLCRANNRDFVGEPVAAEFEYNTALRFLRASDEHWGASIALNNLGMIALEAGRFEDAESLLGESLQLGVLLGDPWRKLMALGSLAELSLARGSAGRAAQLMQQAFELQRETHNIFAVPFDLEVCCRIARVHGAASEVLQFAGATIAVRRRFASAYRADPRIREVVDEARRSLEPDVAEAALQHGAEMDVDAAIECALSWLRSVNARETGPAENEAFSDSRSDRDASLS